MNSTFIAIAIYVIYLPVFIWLVFISWGHFDVVGCTREVRFEIVYLGVCPENEITEIEIDRILFLSCLGFACVPSFFLTNKKGYISNHKRIKTCYFSWFHQPKFLSEMLLSTCYFLCWLYDVKANKWCKIISPLIYDSKE